MTLSHFSLNLYLQSLTENIWSFERYFKETAELMVPQIPKEVSVVPQRVTRSQKKRRHSSTSDLEPRKKNEYLVKSNSKQQQATKARNHDHLGRMKLRPRAGLPQSDSYFNSRIFNLLMFQASQKFRCACEHL